MLSLSSTISRGNRDAILIPIVTILTSFSLAPTSTILPAILTLAVLHTYSRILFPSFTATRILFLVAGISVGGALPNVSAASNALSTTPTSLILLAILSAFTSSIVVAALYAEWVASRHITSSHGRVLLFPAIWSTIWCTVPYFSPVGHLLTWSRAHTLDAYGWMVPVLGTPSQDWIAASWAVVLSEVYQVWYMGPVEDYAPTGAQASRRTRSYTPFLAATLMFLTVPSYFFGNILPIPIGSIEEGTAFGVGCIMPTFQRYKHYQPTLKDYIDETKQFQNRAKFLLWPEGAVSFDSNEERDAAFAAIRSSITGSYVGVSFEQHLPDPADPSGHASVKKTGVAVIGQASATPYLLYYKRHLVPVVESYQLAHSLEPPPLADVTIPRPKDVPPSKWGPHGLRNISVTASICLDFAMPLPFSHLDSRPGLILAPARTWEHSVGISMWLQAKQRAAELNSVVLWCDGGNGGVSGVAGGGYESFEQVGSGSWVKNIGLDYPFNGSQTFYARWQDSTLLVYWIGILSPRLGQIILSRTRPPIQAGLRFLNVLRRQQAAPERQPLLDNTPPLIDYTV